MPTSRFLRPGKITNGGGKSPSADIINNTVILDLVNGKIMKTNILI